MSAWFRRHRKLRCDECQWGAQVVAAIQDYGNRHADNPEFVAGVRRAAVVAAMWSPSDPRAGERVQRRSERLETGE